MLIVLYIFAGLFLGAVALEWNVVSYAVHLEKDWARVLFSAAGLGCLTLGGRGLYKTIKNIPPPSLEKIKESRPRIVLASLGLLGFGIFLAGTGFGLPVSQGMVRLASWGPNALIAIGLFLASQGFLFLLISPEKAVRMREKIAQAREKKNQGTGGESVPETSSQKSNPARIVPVIVLSVTLLGLIPFAYMLYPELERDRLITNGMPAEARILKIEYTGNQINRQPQMRLWLEVRPPNGIPYKAQAKMIVSAMHAPRFQPGKFVRVRFDPEKKQNVAVEGPLVESGR